jgi:hypothetical protein
METGSQIIMRLSGSWMVYPGHPLVLATAIMSIYPDFTSANGITVSGFPQALTDNSIPGSGDHVEAALDTLELGAKGASLEEMIAFANDYWIRGKAGGHIKNVDDGSAQALAMHDAFRELVSVWPVSLQGAA